MNVASTALSPYGFGGGMYGGGMGMYPGLGYGGMGAYPGMLGGGYGMMGPMGGMMGGMMGKLSPCYSVGRWRSPGHSRAYATTFRQVWFQGVSSLRSADLWC